MWAGPGVTTSDSWPTVRGRPYELVIPTRGAPGLPRVGGEVFVYSTV